MNFQTLSTVEPPNFYLDYAFRRAQKIAKEARAKVHIKKTRLNKSKEIELKRIDMIKQSLYEKLDQIVKSFPSIDGLPPFYQDLIKCTLEYDTLKKSLGGVNWARNKVIDLFNIYDKKIKGTRELAKINQYRREFYGRISSLLNQIKDELAYIESSRRIMKNYPTIKTSIPTVAVIGFPNVGKTTLLYKLTGSKPEINSYPFTTRDINIGYLKSKDKRIQIIDTPGTLNRFNKMNNIEKQAYLAIKHCAETLIYVFDLTESYPLKDQIALLDNLKQFKKKTIIFLTKTDIIERKKIAAFLKKYKAVTKIEELKKEIIHL